MPDAIRPDDEVASRARQDVAPTLHESLAKTEVDPLQSRLPDDQFATRAEQPSTLVDPFATRVDSTQEAPPDGARAIPPAA